MRRGALIAGGFAVFWGLIGPKLAEADPVAPRAPVDAKTLAEAKRLFRAGARAYDAGQFDFAVEAFDKAFALAPRPALAFSAAQALRRQFTLDKKRDRLVRARTYYQYYLEQSPQGRRRVDATEAIKEVERLLRETESPSEKDDGPGGSGGGEPASPPPPLPASGGEGKIQVESTIENARATVPGFADKEPLPLFLRLPAGVYPIRIEAPGYVTDSRKVVVRRADITVVTPRLDEKPASLTVTGADGADIVIDRRLVGRAPLAKPIELRAGTYRVAIGRDGKNELFQTVVLERGEARRFDADLSTSTQRIFAWGFIAAGSALFAGGITGSIVVAKRNSDSRRDQEQQDSRAFTRPEAEAFNGDVAETQRITSLTAAGYGLGVLSGGLGAILYFFDDPDLYPADAPLNDSIKPEVDVQARPGGGVLSLTGRF